MPTFLFLAAICLLVAASILLETDASPPPKTNTKLENEPPSSDNAEPDADAVGPPSSGNAELNAGLTLENRWNSAATDEKLASGSAARNKKLASGSAARDKKLEVIGSAQLTVQFIGENSVHRSVLAEQPIPKGNSGTFYYEVKILEKGEGFYIGLATKMPIHAGWDKGSYGYGNWGRFWGHEVEGCPRYQGRPFIREGIPSFGVKDVVGCGVDLKTRQIIYTKNGELLKTTGLLVANSDTELYPCVSLYEPGTIIEANFGTEKFKYTLLKA